MWRLWPWTDLVELGGHVGALYDVPNPFAGIDLAMGDGRPDAVLRWGNAVDPLDDREVRISSLSWKAEEVEFPFTDVREPAHIAPDLGRLEFLLNYIFRFPHFRPRQAEAVMRGVQRRDTIVLLPTGSGKSVVFQLLSLITPGMSFVVCPILSLMDDQVENLRDRGIDRVVGINSELGSKERAHAEYLLGVGQYLMAYVTPERFQNRRFLERVQRYARHNVISTIAIDEAHCVSEWGHDFRPAYLGLADTCRDVCRTGEAVPPLLALTGTASMSVLTDMRHDLGIADPSSIIRPPSFDRPEIHFRVLRVASSEKIGALDYVVRTLLPRDFGSAVRGLYGDRTGQDEVGCGIVFCPHSSGPYGLMNSARAVEHGHLGVWDHLNRVLPDRCGRYAGKPPKALGMGRAQWGKFKRDQARKFKNDELAVMVTTKAFGMGIDKPNVRWVAHFGIPSSLEAYYQEVGRAARDGKFACAYLILSNDFPELNQRMLDPSQSRVDVLEGLEGEKGRYNDDDVSRILRFHTSSFGGADQELECARRVLGACSPERWAEGRWHIPFCENGAGEGDEICGKTAREKAIYRFKLLGVFQSYTMEYGGVGGDGFFLIQPATLKGKALRDSVIERYLDYISSYQSDRAYVDHAAASLARAVEGIDDDRQFIMAVLRHLLSSFTYKVLEEGRRRAILTMLETAEKAFAAGDVDDVDDRFRQELLAYLSTEDEGQIDVLDVLANATDTELLLRVMERYVSDDAVDNMIGQSLRLLEDYPQHYGLHYLLTMGYLLRGEAAQGPALGPRHGRLRRRELWHRRGGDLREAHGVPRNGHGGFLICRRSPPVGAAAGIGPRKVRARGSGAAGLRAGGSPEENLPNARYRDKGYERKAMNLKELEALEAKTVRIVEALEAIEGEQRSCEEQAEVIDSHYGTLSELVERIDGVAKELQKVLSLLQRTDFGRTLDQIESQVSSVEVVASEALRAQDALDERSGRMESSVERVQAVCDAVEARDEMLAAALVAIQESLGSLDERLASLETAVGRIDRNTQKGLGKERG